MECPPSPPAPCHGRWQSYRAYQIVQSHASCQLWLCLYTVMHHVWTVSPVYILVHGRVVAEASAAREEEERGNAMKVRMPVPEGWTSFRLHAYGPCPELDQARAC